MASHLHGDPSLRFFFFLVYLAALGLRCCSWVFSSCGEWGLFFIQCAGSSLWWFLLFWGTGSRAHGLSGCSSQAPEHRLSSCGVGLVAPQHVESSLTGDQTHLPCIGQRILYHWTTREVPQCSLSIKVFAQVKH